MLTGLCIALFLRQPPYVASYEGDGTWRILGPACPGGAFEYSREGAESFTRLLNSADRLADRRDFNGDGYVNSQDLFDLIAELNNKGQP